MTTGLRIDLSGRTALVTGASRGIGRAIARELARAGADIVGLGTSIADDAALAAEIRGLGVAFHPVACDLSDRDAIAGLIDALDRDGPAIDILVNNAGIIRRAPAAEHDVADWDAVMAVNLDAVFLLCRALGARMLARGHGRSSTSPRCCRSRAGSSCRAMR